MFIKVTCVNKDIIAIIPYNARTIEAKYITNPKLKHLKDGDRLLKCPDCHSQISPSSLFLEKVESKNIS